jgi:hypothetical protein
MDAEEIRLIIKQRIELYRVKQADQDALAPDSQNQWDTIAHTIKALEWLQSEFNAALAPRREADDLRESPGSVRLCE